MKIECGPEKQTLSGEMEVWNTSIHTYMHFFSTKNKSIYCAIVLLSTLSVCICVCVYVCIFTLKSVGYVDVLSV